MKMKFNVDSNFKLVLGGRYDPNFRSPGAQTKRIDFISSNLPTVYPMYTNSYLNRRFSTFDLVSMKEFIIKLFL